MTAETTGSMVAALVALCRRLGPRERAEVQHAAARIREGEEPDDVFLDLLRGVGCTAAEARAELGQAKADAEAGGWRSALT